MKLTIILMVFTILIGCKTTSSGDVDITQPPTGEIWNSKSERVFIVDVADGLELGTSDIVYDYSRDTLPAAAKTALFNLTTTTENLTCPSDGGYYTITVTENTGLDKLYLSDNKDCGHTENVEGFIKSEDIMALIPLLNGVDVGPRGY
ncbi:MAG: hypothetical protein V3U84_02065 [Thiotrichaceae bacterium]